MRVRIGYDDPFTQADLSVQKLYYLGLNKYFPGIKIVGEENMAECLKIPINEEVILQRVSTAVPIIEARPLTEEQKKEWCKTIEVGKLNVWVDPLDGTKEFTLGNVQCVTSLLGITVDQVPTYGIIHKPFMDDDLERATTYFGGKGVGALVFREGSFSPLGLFKDGSRKEFCMLTSKSHYSAAMEHVMGILKPDKIVHTGGAGNKILGIIQGVGDCYLFPSHGMKPWDTCAGEGLLLELGGYMADCHGERVKYDKPYNLAGIVCARKKEVVDRILAELKDIPEIAKL